MTDDSATAFFRQTGVVAAKGFQPPEHWVYWHGTPSGDMRGGEYGLHVGTHEAARQALTARIGHPVEGHWDGAREYGKTLLAGKRTLKERGQYPTGYSARAPEEDHYPTGTANYGDGTPVAMDAKPNIMPVRIRGEMSNDPTSPHDDSRANGLMKAQLKRGAAKRGYFYRNVGEDAGSISAVVPSEDHVERLPQHEIEPGAKFYRPGEKTSATAFFRQASAHAGPFYHGTSHEFQPGDMVDPSYELGGRKGKSYAFMTTDPGVAHNYAKHKAWAQGMFDDTVKPHAYEVRPTGPIEEDDTVGDQFRAFRTRHPLQVVREIHPGKEASLQGDLTATGFFRHTETNTTEGASDGHRDDQRTAGRGKPRREPGAGGGAAPQGADPAGGAHPVGESAGAPGPRSVTFHPAAEKELAKLDPQDRKRVKATIDSLATDGPGAQTHPLTMKLKGWSATKSSRGHRVVHRDLDDGTLHVGYVGLHDYDTAIRRLTQLQRGLRVQLDPDKHAFVHDERQPLPARAHLLLSELRKPTSAIDGQDMHGSAGGLGEFWTRSRNVADDAVAYQDERHPAAGTTHVTLHADHPGAEHYWHEMAGHPDHPGNYRVPLRPGAPLGVHGITWSTPGGREHHYDFSAAVDKHASTATAFFRQATELPSEWYHGSGAAFDRFDLNKNKMVQDEGDGKHWNSHLGAHFTSDHKVAQEFAQRQGGGHVYHAHLDLKNPKHYESEYDLDKHAAHWALDNGYDLGPAMTNPAYREHTEPDEWQFHITYNDDWNSNHRPEAREIAHGFRDHLKSQGHDGITYGNEFEGAHNGFHAGERHLSAIAFHPDQVTITQRHGGNEKHSVTAFFRQAEAVDSEDDYRMQHRPLEDGAPAHAMDEGMSEDVYTHPHYWAGDPKHPSNKEGLDQLRRARGNPDAPVSIYRASPPGAPHVMNPGDWVSLSPTYAHDHADMRWHEDGARGDRWTVHKAVVPARHVRDAGTDVYREQGYWGPRVTSEEHRPSPRTAHALSSEDVNDDRQHRAAASSADGGTVRMVPPEEYRKFQFPDYPHAKTLPALVKHFKKTDPDYYSKVRDDVKKNGFTTPILVQYKDQRGNALARPYVREGHHRAAIAHDLGVHLPVGDYDNETDFQRSRKGNADWFEHNQRSPRGVSWDNDHTAAAEQPQGVDNEGHDVELDPIDGWSHKDGSVSHDDGTTVSDHPVAEVRTLGAAIMRQAAAERQEGIMVALVPPREIAEDLALPDGEPVHELHITLAYLGKTGDYTPELVKWLPELVGSWAARQKPVKVRIGGAGKFSNESADEHVLWASADIPGGAQLHSDLAAFLDGHGYRLPSEHGWQPHLTLAYVNRHFRFLPKVAEHSWTADRVWVVVAGKWQSCPLGGLSMGGETA